MLSWYARFMKPSAGRGKIDRLLQKGSSDLSAFDKHTHDRAMYEQQVSVNAAISGLTFS